MKNDNQILVSIDETHHVINGRPLYSNRYNQVQSFHTPPGYAPVESDGECFYIDTEGKPVFEIKFKKAYGFYDGIATVADSSGFFHIDTACQSLHQQRFLWSGNFQEKLCAVQSFEKKLYFHIDATGQPLYPQRYNYVGDFYYGIAVVHNSDGLCTHICNDGSLLHQEYFLELSNYHKGYAIAKDSKGYFHVDKSGNPLYDQRYNHLEPFYNNRSFATNLNGIKLVFDQPRKVMCRIYTVKSVMTS